MIVKFNLNDKNDFQINCDDKVALCSFISSIKADSRNNIIFDIEDDSGKPLAKIEIYGTGDKKTNDN